MSKEKIEKFDQLLVDKLVADQKKFGYDLICKKQSDAIIGCRVLMGDDMVKERNLRYLDHYHCDKCNVWFSNVKYYHPETLRALGDARDSKIEMQDNHNKIFVDKQGELWVRCSGCKNYHCLTLWPGDFVVESRELAKRYFTFNNMDEVHEFINKK